MRVFDKTKINELTDYDLEKGYLKADILITQIPEVAAVTIEQKIQNLIKQGKEVTEINGNMYEVISKSNIGRTVSRIIETPAIPAYEENEEIQIYVPYTEEELQKHLEQKYKQTIVSFIREIYSIDDELAIHRKRDEEPEEFNKYYNYVEACKVKARVLVYG